MPSGNEAGANLFWTPGGKTFGGYHRFGEPDSTLKAQ